jgi:hypothetical protein
VNNGGGIQIAATLNIEFDLAALADEPTRIASSDSTWNCLLRSRAYNREVLVLLKAPKPKHF